jgi:hypothetical protein
LKNDKIGCSWRKGTWSPVHGDSKSCVNRAFEIWTIDETDGLLKVKVNYKMEKLYEEYVLLILFSIVYYEAKAKINEMSGRKLKPDEKNLLRRLNAETKEEEKEQEAQQTEQVILAIERGMRICILYPFPANYLEILEVRIDYKYVPHT